ncbi:hypothetical protein BBF96_14250 [Anoxybacter fermentans]|uniref:Glycosyltransferase 2-like domain-containing protein n=1 Tax=Anoxybacter fermentans TaxID=1323375 RepID=A0A3Q9HS13_9FIRM|nr:glycosyltransferase [Anoxybacter fermentans]AZR74446.1 hypothetical protein BBF96_14250 [Anoxybacter fermentans]
MRIVFWLNGRAGFDQTISEILCNFADGLALKGYEVELLVSDEVLDNCSVKEAAKRVWFEEGNQQILADVLISNRLENLLRNDLYQAGERIWLALEEDLTETINYFENYQLYDEIKVFTLAKKIQDQLIWTGIDAMLIRPGLKLEKFKNKKSQERECRGITISLFDSQPEVLKMVLQGIEMTRNSLNRLEIQLITNQEFKINPNLPIKLKVRPSLEERIQCYEKSDLVLHIPGQERISLIPLEAMAAGVPVIVPQHPAVEEYVRHRQNSLVLSKLHPRGIAISILNIMKFGDTREHLKNMGLKTSLNYNLEDSLQKLEEFFGHRFSLNREVERVPSLNGEEELLDIVIVNYNSGQEIRKCLASLRQYTCHPYQVIVVDNGSEDESLEYLKNEENITLIVNQQNIGFAKACNQGILVGKGKYILLLHSDIRVTDEWLEPLLAEIEKPDVGMVVPRLVKEGDEEQPYQKGGCIIIKRELLNRLGLFDEEFFLYYEDLDYSLRVREKGYRVSYPESSILHKSKNFCLNEDIRAKRDKYLTWSKNYFKEKWGTFLVDQFSERKVDGILFLSLHPWQKRAQRTEALVDYFTRRGQKVIYIEPYCSVSTVPSLEQNQFVYTFKGSGTIYHNLSNQGRRMEMMRELKDKLVEWEIYTPLLIVESPWWEPFIKHIEHRFLIYITPEILLGEDMESYRQIKEKFSQEEKSVLKAADMIIVASYKRTEELKNYKEKLIYSPGGFYPEDLERFLEGHFTMPAELVSLSGYKVGIFGVFNRYFPAHLLSELANQYPDVSFGFIGGITCDLGQLKDIPNLYFLGNKDWDTLLDWLYFFDLILYPYPDKGLNSYLDSYMINYYLAMGKPVVAFDHPELEQFGGVIRKASDDEEFLEMAIRTIYKLDEEKDEEKVRERIHRVRGNSWEDRLDDFYNQLKSQVPILEIPDLKISSEKIQEEKENPFARIFKQLLDSYQRLFRGHKRG